MIRSINNRTEAVIALREMGCKLSESKHREFLWNITWPDGEVCEVWSADLVQYAKYVADYLELHCIEVN